MYNYRIYLGLNNPKTNIEYNKEKSIQHLKTLFDNATIYTAIGLFKNKLETTLVIELIQFDNFDNEVKNICKYLKNKYNQECVMFTKQLIESGVI